MVLPLPQKRLRHVAVLLDDPPERQPSYCEPVPVLRCAGCGQDCASFPGWEIDGPRIPSEAVWRQLVTQAQATRTEAGVT